MAVMKHLRALWLTAGLSLLPWLLWPAPGAADWIETDGSAVAVGNESEEATRARAEADALARGLGILLKEWLSDAELQRQMSALQSALFGRAHEYVEAVSDVARSKAGLRHFWKGRVEFDRAAVERELRALGIVSPWAREPLFGLRVESVTNADHHAVVAALQQQLALNGIRLTPVAELGKEEPDGLWVLRLQERPLPGPTAAGRSRIVTEATIEGDVAGRSFRADLPVVAELAPPADLVYALIVDRVIDLWVPAREAARRAAVWQLGPLRFDDRAAWLRFDRRIWSDRHLFHDVVPAEIRRSGDAWLVRYEFMLPPDAEATAAAWLAAAGIRVQRQGERSFVAEP